MLRHHSAKDWVFRGFGNGLYCTTSSFVNLRPKVLRVLGRRFTNDNKLLSFCSAFCWFNLIPSFLHHLFFLLPGRLQIVSVRSILVSNHRVQFNIVSASSKSKALIRGPFVVAFATIKYCRNVCRDVKLPHSRLAI